MIESMSFAAESQTPRVTERIYEIMGNLNQRYPRLRQLITGLGVMLAVCSNPERAGGPLPENTNSFEEFLMTIEDQEVSSRFKTINETLGQLDLLSLEKSGSPIYKFKWLVEHFQAGEDNFSIDHETVTGNLTDTGASLFVLFGSCTSIEQAEDSQNHSSSDALANVFTLIKPNEGSIKAEGELLTVNGFSTLSREEAIRSAFRTAISQHEKLDISSSKHNSAQTENGSVKTAFDVLITRNESLIVDSYQVTEYKQVPNTDLGLTEHFVTLEIQPGTYQQEISLEPNTINHE